MEDNRDKRPVYMSTFQKRTDKLKSEIMSELDELKTKMARTNAKIYWFCGIGITVFILTLVYHFMF